MPRRLPSSDPTAAIAALDAEVDAIADSLTLDYATEVLADNPVGFWLLDDATGTVAVDASGNANHGTYIGSPALRTDSVGTLVTPSFDGVDDLVSLPYLYNDTNPYTIVGVARADRTDQEVEMVVVHSTSAPSLRLGIGPYDGNIRSEARHLYGGVTAKVQPEIYWGGDVHHVAYVSDGNVGTLYVDGVPAGSTDPYLTYPLDGGWDIGTNADRSSFWQGSIGGVAIYHTALSIYRIAAQANAVMGDRQRTTALGESIDAEAGARNEAISAAKEALVGGAPSHLDSFGEIVDYINLQLAALPPSPSPDIQTFGALVDAETDIWTWTKPAHVAGYQPYRFIEVLLVDAAQGGASGRRGAAGTLRTGGGSGASGATSTRTLRYDDVDDSVPVLVQAGGLGGAAVTTDDTNGNPGGLPWIRVLGQPMISNRYLSYFGSYVLVRHTSNGFPAGGNATGAAAGGVAGSGLQPGSTGNPSSATGSVPAALSTHPGTNQTTATGGAGGGITTANVEGMGGRAAASTSAIANSEAIYITDAIILNSYALGGATPGADGAPAYSLGIAEIPGGGGGGGAGNANGPGGAGGVGGWPGGSGGGGGASVNGFPSGAGGNGADGVCVVITR